MKTDAQYGQFEDLLTDSGEAVQALAWAARALIADVYPDACEVPWPTQRVVGYGVGCRKESEQFCYIGVFKAHINLGFFYGAELPDPDGLLEGTGKLLRHIKIRRADMLQRPAVRVLLVAASTHRMPVQPE